MLNLHLVFGVKFPRFRGIFLSLSTPECFLEKGYYLGSCWSGKGTESVSNRYKSGKGIVLSGTEEIDVIQ